MSASDDLGKYPQGRMTGDTATPLESMSLDYVLGNANEGAFRSGFAAYFEELKRTP